MAKTIIILSVLALIGLTAGMDIFPVHAKFSNIQNGYFQEVKGITFRKYTSLQLFICVKNQKFHLIISKYFLNLFDTLIIIRIKTLNPMKSFLNFWGKQ
jgi:hypothetical protein